LAQDRWLVKGCGDGGEREFVGASRS